MTDLGTIGGTTGSSSADAISGNIIMGSSVASGGYHAFVYDMRTHVTSDLSTNDLFIVGLGIGVSITTSLNGTMLTGNNFAPNSEGFVENLNHRMPQNLPTLGGLNDYTSQINSNGTIAAAATPPPVPYESNGPIHATTWTVL